MHMFVQGDMIVWARRLGIPEGISMNETNGLKWRKPSSGVGGSQHSEKHTSRNVDSIVFETGLRK